MIYRYIEGNRARFPLNMLLGVLLVSKMAFYRWRNRIWEAVKVASERLLGWIKAVLVDFPFYGYRKIKKALWKLYGYRINHKRLRPFLRSHGLMLRKKKRPWIATTDSRHSLRVYPNLIKKMELTSLDQAWGADITYVWVRDHFLYVAVVLDLFSRRILGYAISRHIDAALTVAALKKAISLRGHCDGTIHHSDQGKQYCCHDYAEVLKDNRFRISMSRKGCPNENAQAESFYSLFKVEEVYMNEYLSDQEAIRGIETYIWKYNVQRLHSSLDYRTPVEFEDECQNQKQTEKTMLGGYLGYGLA